MNAHLATRCTHCQTAFRVSMQQLELREGNVRCGACRSVFNGIDTVFEIPADAEFALSPTPDMSDRMTLIDFGSLRSNSAEPSSNMQDELDALSRAIADLQQKPWVNLPTSPLDELASAMPEEDLPPAPQVLPEVSTQEQPGFVQEAKQRDRNTRLWRWVLWLGVPVLILCLAAQLAFYFRNEIAAHVPETAPWIRAACKQLGCSVRLPTDITQLSLQSSRLDTTAAFAERYTLVVQLRNQGDTLQSWPSLDLQLKAADGQLLVRRAFLPSHYVNAKEITEGMPAHSEREIRLAFDLAGEPPVGFDLTLFHH